MEQSPFFQKKPVWFTWAYVYSALSLFTHSYSVTHSFCFPMFLNPLFSLPPIWLTNIGCWISLTQDLGASTNSKKRNTPNKTLVALSGKIAVIWEWLAIQRAIHRCSSGFEPQGIDKGRYGHSDCLQIQSLKNFSFKDEWFGWRTLPLRN